MPSTYSPNLRLVEQATGENSGTWGTLLNDGMIALIDSAVAGSVTISTTGGTTALSANDGTADQSRSAILNISGTLTSDVIIVAPSTVTKVYVVANNTTGAYTVTMSAGGTTITITQGSAELCYTDGTNFYLIAQSGLQGTATGDINMDQYTFDQPVIKRYQEVYYAIGNATGAVNLDWNNGNDQSMTLTGNVVLTPTNFPSSGVGLSMTLMCTQDGTGSRTLTFGSGTVVVPGGGGLTLSTGPGDVDLVFIYSNNGGSTLYCSILKNFS